MTVIAKYVYFYSNLFEPGLGAVSFCMDYHYNQKVSGVLVRSITGEDVDFISILSTVPLFSNPCF